MYISTTKSVPVSHLALVVFRCAPVVRRITVHPEFLAVPKNQVSRTGRNVPRSAPNVSRCALPVSSWAPTPCFSQCTLGFSPCA